MEVIVTYILMVVLFTVIPNVLDVFEKALDKLHDIVVEQIEKM